MWIFFCFYFETSEEQISKEKKRRLLYRCEPLHYASQTFALQSMFNSVSNTHLSAMLVTLEAFPERFQGL